MTTYRAEFLAKVVVLDTETTGQNYLTAEIVESGHVIKENGTWNIYQELHKPDEPIPPMVQSICYITDEMVKDKPRFVDVAEPYQKILDNYKFLVAHNHFYDMRVLTRHGIDTSKHKWYCSWRMVKMLTNGDDTFESTALPYLRFRLGLDVPIELRCHRAGNDSLMTALLFEYILDRLEENGTIDINLPYAPQLDEWLGAPIIYDKFPFGKHKGVPMSEVPISYYKWALANVDSLNEEADNYDPDLAASVSHALDKMMSK